MSLRIIYWNGDMWDNFSQGPESRHMLWFFLCVCSVLYLSVVSNSLWQHGLQPPRLLWPWGFTRQEYWGGLPGLPPWHLPNLGIKPRSPALQVDSIPAESPGKSLWMWVTSFWLTFLIRMEKMKLLNASGCFNLFIKNTIFNSYNWDYNWINLE